jgi:hypothetical protein
MDSLNLDERNFENLVRFYKEGLRRVAQGESATEVFTPNERGKLRDPGILRYKNTDWVIADEAMEYLDS